MHAQVPAEASDSGMNACAHEIESRENAEGKDFMVNFYDSADKTASPMMVTYSGGSLLPVTEADRQEAA